MIEPLRLVKTTLQHTALIPIQVPREEIQKVMGPGLMELNAAVAAQTNMITTVDALYKNPLPPQGP